MKPETIRMLEKWKASSFEPKQGIVITRDYMVGDFNSIELMWFAEYSKSDKEYVLNYYIKNLADDVNSLNIHIDNVEKNELRKIIDK